LFDFVKIRQRQISVARSQRTLDRRTGELNGSLSGSAYFTLPLAIMDNAQ
jgi:hypothetical protein